MEAIYQQLKLALAPNGTLIPFAPYFPDGLKPVIDYVHSLGLKFGLCAPPCPRANLS